MEDKKPTPLEELGLAINKAVEKTGEVRGEVSIVEGQTRARIYPVTLVYNFLNKFVEENIEYPFPWHLQERAMADCMGSIQRVVNPDYTFSYQVTPERNKRKIIIKKPWTGYGGRPILLPGTRSS